jgi:hypothetical protein
VLLADRGAIDPRYPRRQVLIDGGQHLANLARFRRSGCWNVGQIRDQTTIEKCILYQKNGFKTPPFWGGFIL